jgi:DNA-binding response OmpR family regulator
MLTAKVSDDERVRGLELGADDYLTKPFNPGELVLRAQTFMKRSGLPIATLEEPVRALSRLAGTLGRGAASAERITQLLEQSPLAISAGWSTPRRAA